MMKRFAPLCAIAFFLCAAVSTQAADLISVYRDACASDPAFKAAQAEFQVARQFIPLSASHFLPQVSLTGHVARLRNDYTAGDAAATGPNAPFYNNTFNYTLLATQSLFNFANWAALSTAKAQVKQAGANLCAAAQDLMIRTASAYFSVLRASEDLRFTQAEKRAIAHQLEQNKERFKVGLIAITAVYEAQARHDDIVAREIAAKNQYSNRIEELREITGRKYPTLLGITNTMPLVSPNPTNIDAWMETAEKQNYALQAARYGSLAARENIKTTFAGHLPIVEGEGAYTYDHQDNNIGAGATKSKIASIGLSATLPITSGGAVIAATRQARHQYEQATSVEELTHRSVIAQTRKTYWAVLSGISQIRADKQAIISSQSALDATLASYEVGTRTMVDVLDAQSKLYDIQRITVAEQYNYLLQTLLLKQTTGSLSPEDFAKINKWLKKPTRLISDQDILHTALTSHRMPEALTSPPPSKSQSNIRLFYSRKSHTEKS